MPSNFKVLAGASGEPIDPNFRNVTLLLHGDGNNGGQNNAFVDSSSNHFPISRNGNTTQGSFSPYGSNWSNYFDGTGDYLSVPNNAALNMSGSTFTLECWIYPNGDYSDYRTIMSKRNASTTSYQIFLFQTTGYLSFSRANTAYQSSATPTANAWNHVAAVYDGTNINLYLNGTRVLQTAVSIADTTDPLLIGAIYTGGENFNGYISNARVLKGTQAYTGTTYTVPTAPLTAITNTSLLTCAYNRFRDGSTNNFTITRNGDVKVTNFAPFAPSSPAAYDQSDVQYWSGAFDGNGDFLQISGASAFSIATSTTPFTIEGWIYPTAAGGCVFSEEYTGTGNSVSIAVIMSDGTSETTGRYITFGCYTGTTWILSAVSNVEVALNTWTHVACVFTGSTTKIYFNGVDVTKTSSPTPATTWGVTGVNGSAWFVGRRWDTTGTAYFTGYISNFRFVNGTAVYASAFTPPTSPLTAITNTSLLTCQNAAFTDNSANKFAITANGNATVVGNSPYNPAGYWSNSFDGSGDYLTATSNAAFQFGTGDFTIEAWIYVTNYASTCAIFDTRTSGNETSGVIFYVRSDGKIELYRSAAVVTASTALSQNSWNHVAVTRSGSTCTLWLNGVSVGTATDSTNLTQQNSFIGAAYTGSANMMVGYISNLRIVKGAAVYTSNFTPSTTPLTAISGTSLLTCQANRFIDSSANAFTITRNGDVAVRDFDPFTSASVTSTGGSGYFDGTGDNITVPRNSALIPTTGDFTVECWIYPFSNSSTQIIAGFIDGNVAGDWRMAIVSAQLVFWAGTDIFYGTVIPYAWNHVMCCRSGSTLYIGINGVAGTQTNTSSLNNGTNYPLSIGGDFDANVHLFTGYISDFRMINGSAAYPSTTYTVPTSPIRPTTNTQLLCNFTNAAIFDNSMKNDLETVGNAQISTSVKKFGTGSIYFDGSGDYLRAANNDIFAFGTGDFTVEMWAYFADNTATNRPLLDTGVNSNTGRLLIRQGNDAGTSNVVNAFVSGTTVGSPTISFNQWTHVAVVRQSGTVKIYINGTGGTGVSAAADLTQNGCLIGAFYDQLAWNFTGYIDDLRITKGVARYTANFTAPTAPFPNK